MPCKGTGQTNLDVNRGQVSMIFSHAASVMPHVQYARLRALGITSTAQHPGLPEAPTQDEATLRGFEYRNCIALFAPKRTPTAALARLNTAINHVVLTAAMQKSFEGLDSEPMIEDQRQWKGYVRSEIAKLAHVVKEAILKLQ